MTRKGCAMLREVPSQAAILAEVFQPRLFRRWLVNQGSRVFRRIDRTNCLGLFLDAVAPGWDLECRCVRLSQAAPWWGELYAWIDRQVAAHGSYTAAEVVDALDTIMAVLHG